MNMLCQHFMASIMYVSQFISIPNSFFMTWDVSVWRKGGMEGAPPLFFQAAAQPRKPAIVLVLFFDDSIFW